MGHGVTIWSSVRIRPREHTKTTSERVCFLFEEGYILRKRRSGQRRWLNHFVGPEETLRTGDEWEYTDGAASGIGKCKLDGAKVHFLT